jgi:phenylalanyl-tRNA synthetase beta chain
MKLSLSWIFDHIAGASWHNLDVDALVHKFNVTTAEIDAVEKVTLDLSRFFLVTIKEIRDNNVVVQCDETSAEYTLPLRDDAQIGNVYMIIKGDKKDSFAWAKLTDWQSSKDGLLPAFHCPLEQRAGSWKKELEVNDYIFEVSNTTITHRPDLWGHRGVAREIAAMLNESLVSEENLVTGIPTIVCVDSCAPSPTFPYTVTLQKNDACRRFAALYVPEVVYKPSSLWMALRLARVDVRPLNAIVDATNYTMLDLSEPLHAFDADKLASATIGPRMARDGETLELLDGETVTLTKDDLVIADGKRAVALAGIMGGETTKVTEQTHSLVVEAASFNPSSVRRTAMRLKKRTDGSTRFEKNLDPNQNISALKRFAALLIKQGIRCNAHEIVSLGALAHPGHISLSHKLIEEALGISITPEFVMTTLTKLGMTVVHDAGQYGITVPTFRSTKDVRIPEDIIEEIGRCYGYEAIPLKVPALPLTSHSLDRIERRRIVEQVLAHGMRAREVYNYPLYDELYLKKIDYEPVDTVALTNPVSEQSYRLVDSLIPHLFKSVEVNASLHQPIRFFEWGRTWKKTGTEVHEDAQLAAILVDHVAVDFYDIKAYFQELFSALGLNVTWRAAKKVPSWCHPYQTAELVLEDVVLGYAGKIHPRIMATLGFKDGFVCQMLSNILLAPSTHSTVYKPASKYQGSWFDVSMLIARSVTVSQLQDIISACDKRIVRVTLKDFFHKPEWGDKHSVTLRFFIQSYDATLTKEELDLIYLTVQKNLTQHGATIR